LALYTHLQPIGFFHTGKGIISHVSLSTKACIALLIASCHPGCLHALEYVLGSGINGTCGGPCICVVKTTPSRIHKFVMVEKKKCCPGMWDAQQT